MSWRILRDDNAGGAVRFTRGRDCGRQPTIACAIFSASAGFGQVVRSAENDTSEGPAFAARAWTAATRALHPFYLDGMTHEAAAQEPGCPKGTVESRLAWARQRLQARLRRRGLAPTALLLPAALARSTAAVVVPAALVRSLQKAAQHMQPGAAVGAASARSSPGLRKKTLTNYVD